MPFVPFDDDEKTWIKPVCRNPQHDPPSHIVINKAKKWVCPGCGASCILRPRIIGMADKMGEKNGGCWQTETPNPAERLP